MLITETELAVGEKRPDWQAGAAGEGKGQPPADFVYDNGQIMLELLHRRAAEVERRSFVEGLRRLGDNTQGTESI